VTDPARRRAALGGQAVIVKPRHDDPGKPRVDAALTRRRVRPGILPLIGKYGGDGKATEGAPALLPLPSRERAGVRVDRGAACPLTLTLSPVGEREMEWNTSRVISDQG
jgi:hypothetical protein